MVVIGIGLDVVDIPSYIEQLHLPGTTIRKNFTAREWTDAQNATNTDKSLAGRWAAKEAVIKAWSVSRYGKLPKIPPHTVQYEEIEVTTDTWNRPVIRLHGDFAQYMSGLRVHVSISHDGQIAAAVAVIEDSSVGSA